MFEILFKERKGKDKTTLNVKCFVIFGVVDLVTCWICINLHTGYCPMPPTVTRNV